MKKCVNNNNNFMTKDKLQMKEIMTKDKLQKRKETEDYVLFEWVSDNQPAMVIFKQNGNVHRLDDYGARVVDEGANRYWLVFDGLVFYTVKEKEEYRKELFKDRVDDILSGYEKVTGFKLRDKAEYDTDWAESFTNLGNATYQSCYVPLTEQQYIIFKRQYKTTIINNFL